MKNQVTIVPADKLIIVDGIGLILDFEIAENIHAIQWQGTSGHCEYTDDSVNRKLTAEDYETEIASYVALWEVEKARIEEEQSRVEEEYNKPENVRSRALSRIDFATSKAILAGFEYEIEGETLHFSYDHDDQQNFSDTFNGVAMKKLMGVEDLPETIDWNGWRNHTQDSKGELVVLTLTPDDFLNLYTQGALVHKQTHLETGKQRKKAIENASSVDEINNLLKEWNI